MTHTLLVLLKVSVGVLIFAIGLASKQTDLTYLWRRPGLLLRSLVAMYVLVPLAALLMVTVLPLATGVKAGLLVLAASAGAPLLPRKLGAFGRHPFTVSLVLTSSLLSIVLVPAWIGLLSGYFSVAAEISPTVVATAIAKAFLLPLVIGMVVRAVWPGLAEALSDRLTAVAGLALTACAVLLLVMHWELVLNVRSLGMAALVALMVIALAIGHALGGPGPDDRTALAVACSTRHVGIAVLVATAFPGPRTVVLLAVYVVASAAVSIPYLAWRRRKSHFPDSAAESTI